jgi:anti-anti-sigma factor
MVELLKIAAMDSRQGLKLSGEVDISNAPDLAASISSCMREAQDIHIDLSDLEFIDGAGVRVLIQAANRLSKGRRIVLWSAPGFFKRLLDVLKVDETWGLRLAS